MSTPQTPRKKETATAGKGMPTKQPKPDQAMVDLAPSPHDAAVEASLSLPHERDQSIDMTPDTKDPVIKQASKDIKRGLQDTSKGLEMDKTYDKLKR